MRLKWLMSVALCVLTLLFVSVDAKFHTADATIYHLNINRVKPTAAQRGKVRRIMRKSTRDLHRILRKYGINPHDRYPPLVKISRAANELMAVEHRERAALSKVLTPKQMRIYGQLTAEVRRRVTNAVMNPPQRPSRARNLKKRKKRKN